MTPTPTCAPHGNCVYTRLFWRDNPDAWPVQSLNLGNVSYTKEQLLDILEYPGFPGDGLNPMARELISAKLNVANAAGHECVDDTITQVDSIIGDSVPKPVGNDTIPLGNVQGFIDVLTSYNKGDLCCAMHCSTTPSLSATATATPTIRPTTTSTPTPCQLDKPAVECSRSASSNIAVNVIAGESGTPSGFVVEWMTMSDFVANGNQWPDDPSAVCQATFTGDLAPNQTIEVVIGDDRLFDSVGVQSDCSGEPLLCDTAYVFRCRTNATQSCDASVWGNTITCATLPCDPGHNCTYTQGFWKKHSDAWPLQNLMLGAVSYDASQLLQILNRPAQGNGLITLAHQLIAAKLNIGNDADPTAAQQAAIDADTIIGGLIIPPIGNGYLSPGQTSNLADTLTEYNEGPIGLGHCSD